MKKVLVCGLIAAAFGVTAAPIGGSVLQGFDVKATVTPTCVANNATTPTIDFGAIAAFDPTLIASKSTNIAFKCSKGLLPTATLSAASSSVAGLDYSLAVDTGTKTAGTGVTGDAFVFKVTASMAAGQAGDTFAPTTDSQTLTIAF